MLFCRPNFIKMKELAQSKVTSKAIRTALMCVFSGDILFFFVIGWVDYNRIGISEDYWAFITLQHVKSLQSK